LGATADNRLYQYILKVAARCNLNCTYCYVFNKGDSTWKQRPPIMSDTAFTATLERIRRHCLFAGQKSVKVLFHGGEPTLVGTQRFDSWCEEARKTLEDVAEVRFSLQTNGTLLNDEWAKVLLKHNVFIGISMDGPKRIHDRFRVDHKGQGSYERVERGLSVLREAKIPFGILTVIPFGAADPVSIHRHFVSLGTKSVGYLLPDFTHDTIAPIRQRYGLTPCADFLIPIFDEWWFNGTPDFDIREFREIARLIMGGRHTIDFLGNDPAHYVVVETDGEIEGLDCLRVCEEGMTKTGLNVMDADFRDIERASAFHARAMFEGKELPQACRSCPERDICGGGYLPHRYSRDRGFDNPSVWCADLLRLFAHIRHRLGVSVEQTQLCREALIERDIDRFRTLSEATDVSSHS
jgi:uncharacterized protein